jgi:hypothetical protein
MNWGVFKFVVLMALAGPPLAMLVGEWITAERRQSTQCRISRLAAVEPPAGHDPPAAASTTAPDEVLHFWRPTCPVSLETQARVRLLQRQGYTIRSINTLQDRQLSAAYGINATPTFVSIKAGREISRVSAGIDSQEIKKLCHGQ